MQGAMDGIVSLQVDNKAGLVTLGRLWTRSQKLLERVRDFTREKSGKLFLKRELGDP